jgi:hypothetical protein
MEKDTAVVSRAMQLETKILRRSMFHLRAGGLCRKQILRHTSEVVVNNAP